MIVYEQWTGSAISHLLELAREYCLSPETTEAVATEATAQARRERIDHTVTVAHVDAAMHIYTGWCAKGASA